MCVCEVLASERLAIGADVLFAKVTIKSPVEYIRYRSVDGFTGRAVVQKVDEVLVEEHRLEARTDRQMLELDPWLSRLVIPRFLASGERTMVEVFVRPRETAAELWAAVRILSTKSGKFCDATLGFEQRLHILKLGGKGISQALKSVPCYCFCDVEVVCMDGRTILWIQHLLGWT